MASEASLKWNNHGTAFIQNFSELKQKKSVSDVIVACDGKFYDLHKLVLSACSKYFERIFDYVNCPKPVIILKDITSKDFESLIDYMYSGEVHILQERLTGVIEAAECLRIQGLGPLNEDVVVDNNVSSLREKDVDPASKRRKTDESEVLGSLTNKDCENIQQFDDTNTNVSNEASSAPNNLGLSQVIPKREDYSETTGESYNEIALFEDIMKFETSDNKDEITSDFDHDDHRINFDCNGDTWDNPAHNDNADIITSNNSVRGGGTSSQFENSNDENIGHNLDESTDSITSSVLYTDGNGFMIDEIDDHEIEGIDVIEDQDSSLPIHGVESDGNIEEENQSNQMIVSQIPDMFDAPPSKTNLLPEQSTSKSAGDERLFNCDACDYSTRTEEILIEHINVHKVDKVCDSLPHEKRITRSSHQSSNIVTPTVKSSHNRTYCKNKVRGKAALKKHVRYECKYCKKIFSYSSQLSKHICTHKSKKSFECPHCKRKFNQSSHLNSHIKTHTGERPFQCSYCGKTFPRSSDVNRHNLTHTGEKPHECRICKKKFTQSYALKKHSRIHDRKKT